MNEFSVEKHGLNIVAIRTKDFTVKLEYDFTVKGFREFSDYLVTKTYSYRDKIYHRDLPINRHRYYKFQSTSGPLHILYFNRKSNLNTAKEDTSKYGYPLSLSYLP